MFDITRFNYNFLISATNTYLGKSALFDNLEVRQAQEFAVLADYEVASLTD